MPYQLTTPENGAMNASWKLVAHWANMDRYTLRFHHTKMLPGKSKGLRADQPF
jgi:hypothetical protein